MTTTTTTECFKCTGRGQFDAYKHLANGRCFQCGGTGRMPMTVVATAPAAERAVDAAKVERELMTRLRNAQTYGAGWALEGSYGWTCGRDAAGWIKALPEGRREKCVACFAAVLPAADVAEIRRWL